MLDRFSAATMYGAYSVSFAAPPPTGMLIQWVEFAGPPTGCEGFSAHLAPGNPDGTPFWFLYLETSATVEGTYQIQTDISYPATAAIAKMMLKRVDEMGNEAERRTAVGGHVVIEAGLSSVPDWWADHPLRISGNVEFPLLYPKDLGCAVDGLPDGGIHTVCYCQDKDGTKTTCESKDGKPCCVDLTGERTSFEFSIEHPERCRLMCSTTADVSPAECGKL